MTTYLGRIQLLAKTASEWSVANPVLMLGEIGAQDVGSTVPVLKIGDGVRPFSLLPNLMTPVNAANDYVAGNTTTLPPGSAATVTIDNTVDPPVMSFGIPQGAIGPANALTIGTVTTGAPGSPASATITGTPPNQVLSLTLPQGAVGPPSTVPGPPGPPNSLAIGTVTTGAPGSPASATITGTPPNQTLSLTIPQGSKGDKGDKGDAGSAGAAAGATTQVQFNDAGAFAGTNTFIFDKATNTLSILRSGGTAQGTQQWSDATATFLQGISTTGATKNFILRATTDSAGTAGSAEPALKLRARLNNDLVSISDPAITFGNSTSNPTFAFLGSGAATFNGPVIAQTTATNFNPIAFLANGRASNDRGWAFRIGGGGDLQIAPANDDGSVTGNNPALYFAKTGKVTTSLNFGSADNPAFNFLGIGKTTTGGNLNVNSGTLYLTNRNALDDMGDGYLRLNNGSNYSNGVYTPGRMRADGGLESSVASSLVPFGGGKSLGFNPTTYGTVVVGGATGGYVGYQISDSPLNTTFMSNGADCGIYVTGDGKWLVTRSTSTLAQSNYLIAAPGFNIASSRTLKRETGTPDITYVREVLRKLRVRLWHLLADPDAHEEIGPFAEDAHELCPWLSSDGKTIKLDKLAWLLLVDWQERDRQLSPGATS